VPHLFQGLQRARKFKILSAVALGPPRRRDGPVRDAENAMRTGADLAAAPAAPKPAGRLKRTGATRTRSAMPAPSPRRK
jgi:hypothetical protein